MKNKKKLLRRVNAMNQKDKEKSVDLYNWMLENWAIEGGFLPQATAARLMMVTKARVTQMIKEGKLKEFRFENQVFVQYGETMRYARQKVYQVMNESLVKELKDLKKNSSDKIPEEKFKELETEIKEVMEKAENNIEPNFGSQSSVITK